jgi:hypothetical protein
MLIAASALTFDWAKFEIEIEENTQRESPAGFSV